MDFRKERTELERSEFFFRYNSIVLQGGPAIVLGSCLFWSISDLLNDDMYCLIKSGAIWMILLLMLASVAVMAVVEKHKVKKELTDKEMKKLRIWAAVYFLILILAVSMIIGAENMQAAVMGDKGGVLMISLSSTLLFIIVFGGLSKGIYGIMFFVEAFLALLIPFAMPGSEEYALLPEAVLRVCLAFAYYLVWRRTNKSFMLQRDLREINREIEETNEEVIDLLINAVEIRDTESGEHTKKVRNFTRILATEIMNRYPEYNLTPRQVELITRASGMHDIGKIMIPDEILLKPGSLTSAECEIMKTHSEKGYDLLARVPRAWGGELIMYSKDICLYHHEKYDGAGYPCGLVGEEIPIWAQIVSVADCYEALTSVRSYKDPYLPDRAYEMIMIGECGVFSEKILSCLTNCRGAFEEELKKHENNSEEKKEEQKE